MGAKKACAPRTSVRCTKKLVGQMSEQVIPFGKELTFVADVGEYDLMHP